MTKLLQVAGAILLAIAIVPMLPLPGQQEQTPAAQVDPQLVQRLVEEIESIIPTRYEEGSDQEKQVIQIATAYLERKGNKVRNLLEGLATMDASLPPNNLILAGISFATNNPVQGRNLLERVGADHREHPGVALAFGRLALLQGRYFDALTLVEKANDLAKQSTLEDNVKKFYVVEVHNTMTVIEMRRNDMTRASELVQKWAVLDPTSSEMLIASAEISFQKSEFSKAEELLNQRSEQMNQQLPSAVIMAKWFRAKEAFNRTEVWVKKAYEQHPENPVVQLEYAGWLLRNGNYDEAEGLVSKFESDTERSQDVYSLKGRIAFGRTRYDEAAKNFKVVYLRQPNNFENSTLYVFSLLETHSTENHQQAIALAQRNFQAFPNSQLAALVMSVALQKAGKADAADQLLERAARMGNILPDTAYFMAKKLKMQDRGLQAKIMLDSFLDSKDTFLYRERARQLIDSIGDLDSSLPEPGGGGGK